MRNLLTGIVGLLVLFVFYSCQKEVSLEYGSPAQGSLQGDRGDCLPKLVGGSYNAGKALNDSNFLEVTVDVVTPGPYTITTDSVNGFIFKASGTFTTIGANTIRLKGSGIPENEGVNNFTVVFDSSYCKVTVTVLPAGSTGGAAAFTLQGAPAACTAFDLGGTYYKDTTLDGRHTVKVNVNVTSVGTYTITTNTQNGYFFSNTGTFGGTGPTQVVLNGSGKPLAVGTDNFTVTAGSSSCTFPVTVSTPTTNPPAGACGATPQGTYTVGTALVAGNTILVPHTFATAGTYTVSTNPVNGYSFSSGSINATAGTATNITLTGTGTPTAAGTNTFTINFGDGQTCTFTVTVNPATPPVSNNDYFPLTANSYWTYSFPVANPTDTISKVNNGSATSTNGTVYRTFEVFDNAGVSSYDEYYRRSGNDYLEYTIADAYSDMTFDGDVEGDILFLKEGLTVNQTWNSAEFTGTVSGAAQKLRYVFKCIDANATVTVNGKTYSNVYKVTMTPQVSTNGGTSWTSEALVWETWYARGIGMVQQKVTAGATSITIGLRYYKIF
jgi:hypothetical protein